MGFCDEERLDRCVFMAHVLADPYHPSFQRKRKSASREYVGVWRVVLGPIVTVEPTSIRVG